VRLLMTLLGICMDTRFEAVLIDEPELGLSPRIQETFSQLLGNQAARREWFPHLQHVFIATHSHLFLTRRDVTDNFVVAKDGSRFALRAVQNLSEFHRLQFNLLGNSLEALFLPAAIVVVEGKTDFEFIDRVVRLKYPDRRITVVPAHGDGEVKRVVAGLRRAFGDLQLSPMRGRLFVALDSVHQPGLKAELEAMGVLPGNIATWMRNGVEYLYPADSVAREFGCAVEAVGDLEVDGDRVRIGEVVRTKAALAAAVVGSLDRDTALPTELHERLLGPLEAAIA
jgi:hypothetical protein